MKIDYNEVPFYANSSDDTHCFQACLKMVLKFFLPKQNFSWNDLDKITAYVEGLWTWPTVGLIWLKSKGFDVKNIELFDYEKFNKLKGQYLIDLYGREVGEAQIKHSNIDQEIKYAKEFKKKFDIEKRIPNIDDIENLLKDNYLLILSVNSNMLDNEPGYTGHFVLVKGFSDLNLILHDPGLPPRKNRTIDFETFERAWAYPDDNSKSLIAVKFNSKNKKKTK